MKIEVIVRFGTDQRNFIVPCGDGNKTFKWLASVASQRFINSTPNGHLRRRELLCAGNEQAQYQAQTIVIINGEAPHPLQKLVDKVADGDCVIVELTDQVNVNQLSGLPQASRFSSLAYSLSDEHLTADLSAQTLLTVEDLRNQGNYFEDNDSDVESLFENEQAMNSFVNNTLTSSSSTTSLNGGSFNSELKSKIRSQIQFMKLMLKSQLIDDFRIESQVERHFSVIHKLVQGIKNEDVALIKQHLIRRWDLLHDVFYFYCITPPAPTTTSKNSKSAPAVNTNNGYATMDSDGFFRFVDDASLFPVSEIITRTSLVFTHTIKRIRAIFTENYHKNDVLDFDGFIAALLYAAQLKYNDTLDSKYFANHHIASETFDRLLTSQLIPLAVKNDSPTILKEAFLSDECLFKIRFHYNYLQAIFDKTAAKSRDIPVSVTIQDFAELLFQLGINGRSPQDITFASKLAKEVRSGTIYGRSIDDIPEEYKQDSSNSNEVFLSDNNLVISENELTYAEFIEATARAGYHFFSKPNPLNSANFTSGGNTGTNEEYASMTVVDYLLKGINMMSDLAQGKKKRNQSAANKDAKSKTTNVRQQKK